MSHPSLFPCSDNRTKYTRKGSDAISYFSTPPTTIVTLATIDHLSGSSRRAHRRSAPPARGIEERNGVQQLAVHRVCRPGPGPPHRLVRCANPLSSLSVVRKRGPPKSKRSGSPAHQTLDRFNTGRRGFHANLHSSHSPRTTTLMVCSLLLLLPSRWLETLAC